MEGPAGAVGVQHAGQAEGAEDMGQGGHDGRQILRGPELRVEQAFGGVVEDGDEGLPLVGP